MDKRLLLLKELLERNGEKLMPERELASPFGHGYPVARQVLETSVGKETEDLEWLSNGGYLERQFFDKIHLCPYCSHYAINFHEVCPRCRSADTGIVEMVHHFRCGTVAPEAEFRNGARFTCPKCRRPLRHLGVDYERPSASYVCGGCRHLFLDPPVSCRCLNCSEEFDVAKAKLHSVYSYSLSENGAIAASRERLEDGPASGKFVDEELAIYSFEFFGEQLGQEVRKSERYERPVSVMVAGPDNLTEYQDLHGTEAAARCWRDIMQVAREELRDCDIPARAHGGVSWRFSRIHRSQAPR